MKQDFSKIRHYFFLSSLAAVTLWLCWLVKPFFFPIFWAAVIAWLFYPLYKKVNEHFINHRGLASFVTIILIFLIFLVPFTAIVSLIVQQSFVLYQHSRTEVAHFYDQLKHLVATYGDSSLIHYFDNYGIDIQEKIVQAIQVMANSIQSWLTDFTKGTIRTVIGFMIMLYAVYYFFKDGEEFIKKLIRLSPLDDKNERFIYQRFTSTIRATIKGSLLVALIQGLIAGIVFWIAGVVAPFFWGMVMVVMALLPVVGPGLLAFPAGIILLLSGQVWQGVFVLVVGVGLVSIIDNILRPYLVGRDIEIHPLLIFFSTIGGLLAFGPAGFIIGPVVASVFVSLWHMYEKEYQKQLDRN